MLESWWLAHKLELVITGGIFSALALGFIVHGIIEWIKRCLKGEEG